MAWECICGCIVPCLVCWRVHGGAGAYIGYVGVLRVCVRSACVSVRVCEGDGMVRLYLGKVKVSR